MTVLGFPKARNTMNAIRPWLFVGKFRETTNLSLLQANQIDAMLQLVELVEQPGIDTLYLNIDDGVPLPIDKFLTGIDFMKAHQADDKRILVSCGAGISRSTSFAIAALKETEGLPLLDAFREVKRHHPQTLPHPHYGNRSATITMKMSPILKSSVQATHSRRATIFNAEY